MVRGTPLAWRCSGGLGSSPADVKMCVSLETFVKNNVAVIKMDVSLETFYKKTSPTGFRATAMRRGDPAP